MVAVTIPGVDVLELAIIVLRINRSTVKGMMAFLTDHAKTNRHGQNMG